ncbi:hypothetical protein XA68_11302 [Ophiocordyceps unilateralis]|uniref:Peptidase M43 pregnancy-associated plasma-A domain-containing protein n=1 Tax=Ophiocordyceps unilateralis TaxID=268505 RepID=A0A2A9PHA3_OPHUN|nr:hypothetical protein XA68_11302 [Ophiocordyceps unilateralis]
MPYTRLASICGLLAAAATWPTLVSGQRFRCGVKPVKGSLLGDEARIVSEDTTTALSPRDLSTSNATAIRVETYIHVIASGTNSTGHLSRDVVMKQFDVLNQDFSSAGISFQLANLSWIVKPEWARPDNDAWDKIQEALNQGGNNTLNIYITEELIDKEPEPPKPPKICRDDKVAAKGIDGALLSGMENGTVVAGVNNGTKPSTLFGIATVPWALGKGGFDNAAFIVAKSLPGGAGGKYLGKTAVHEVGHWLGLLHTFNDECSDDFGDLVPDTPFSIGPSWGCPEGRDSFPDRPGLDPIHNYMDYSDESCKTEFTPGQMRRMRKMWNTLRNPDGRTPPPAPGFNGKLRAECEKYCIYYTECNFLAANRNPMPEVCWCKLQTDLGIVADKIPCLT